MDSYNRGYNAGIVGADLSDLSDGSARIGEATISYTIQDAGIVDAAEALNFYAIAYDYEGQKIVAFRGTDDPLGLVEESQSGDLLTGWVTGFGITEDTQATLAQEFYQAVTGSDPFDASTAGPGMITLTGHSLGGGLAGHIASLTGDDAVIFDNSPYGAATVANWLAEVGSRSNDTVTYTIDDALAMLAGDISPPEGMSLPGNASIDAIYVDGEMLESVRNFASEGPSAVGISQIILTDLQSYFSPNEIIGPTGALTFSGLQAYAAIVSAATEVDENAQYQEILERFGTPGANTVERHAISGLIVQKYATEAFGADGPWSEVYDAWFDSLFDDDIGAAAGFAAAGTDGAYSQSAKMLSAIAYSVIDEGALVFGNTGVRALFDDLNELGLLLNDGIADDWDLQSPLSLTDLSETLVQATIQFAGQMALQKVDFGETNGAIDPTDGIVGFSSAGNYIAVSNDPNASDAAFEIADADVLTINLSEELWSVNKLETGSSSSPAEVFNWIEEMVELGVRRIDPDTIYDDGQRAEVFSSLYGEGTTGRLWNDTGFGEDYFYRVDVALQSSVGTVVLSDLPGFDLAVSGNMAGLFAASETAQSVIGNDKNTVFVMSDEADDVIGLGGRDIIFGGAGNDLLFGGDGVDFVFGGIGDDFISGGIGSDTIDGGEGWDVLSYADLGRSGADTGLTSESAGVTVDLFEPANSTDASISNIEVFVGSEFGDSFVGSNEGGEWFAGGEGNDTFTISRFASGDAPTVIWGGGGEDTIRITTEAYDQTGAENTGLGILLVDAPNITEENFYTLDLADLGLNMDFVNSDIDVILINQEEQDTVFENRYGYLGEALPNQIMGGDSDGGDDPGVDPPVTGYFDQEIATVAISEIVSPFVQGLSGFNSDINLVDRRGFGTDPFESLEYGGANYTRTETIVVAHHTLDIGDQEIAVFGGAADLGFRFSGEPPYAPGTISESASPRLWSTETRMFYIGAPVRRHQNSELYDLLFDAENRPQYYPHPLWVDSLFFDSLDEYPTILNIRDFGGNYVNGTDLGTANKSWFIVGGTADASGITTEGALETYTLELDNNDITDRLDALLGSRPGSFVGSAENDVFFAGSDAVFYDGREGVGDRVVYTRSDEGLTVDLTDVANNTGIAAGDTYINIELIQGSNFDDILIASGDIRKLHGRDGDDLLIDGEGATFLRGGSGADVFRFISGDGAEDRVLDFEIGVDRLDLSDWAASSLSDLNIEEHFNGAGEPTGSLIIRDGEDIIRLVGLSPIDLPNLSDADFIFGPGNGIERDGILSGTAGDDVINSSFIDIDNDTLSNVGQTISAGDGDDRILDGWGNDDVSGGAGNDVFIAGGGADSYNGGEGDSDRVVYTRSDTGLTVDMSDTSQNSGIATGDTYAGIERLHGSNYDDILIAADDLKVINGRDGDDIIFDAAGLNVLVGGEGADTFIFVSGDGEEDRIFDFEIGIDLIDISAWGVTDFTDLSITERLNSAGEPLGNLEVNFNDEIIRLLDLTSADIPSLTADSFVLV